MNFTQSQARRDNSLPPNNDTSASERRDAFLADQIRTSLDPMDRLIVKHADALNESVEAINQIIVEANWTWRRRTEWADEWDIALSDGMSPRNDRTLAICELLKTGADDCQLGKLIREVTMDSFAERCVSAAEDEVMS
jgi:hypothetical protein